MDRKGEIALAIPDSRFEVRRFGGEANDIFLAKYSGDEVNLLACENSMKAHVAKYAAKLENLNKHLRESEERFRAVTESASDAIVTIDEQGEIVYCNRGTEHIFGYSREELIGQARTGLLPERFRAAHRHGLARFLATGEARVIGKTVELVGMKKDGVEFPLELSLATYELSGRRFFTGFLHDITACKRAEEAIEDNTVLLQNVINASPDFTIVKDRNLRTTPCNDAVARAIGKRPQELYGKTDLENGWPRERVKGNPSKGIRGFEADDREALAGRTVHNPFDPANVGNDVFYFDTWKVPLRDAQGTIFGVLAVARDVTGRNKAEQALRESEEKFRDLFEKSSDLIQSAAADGSLLYVNRAWREALGYTDEEVKRLSIFEMIDPDALDHCKDAFMRVIAGEALTIETALLAKDGRKLLVEGSVNCQIAHGKPVSTRGIFRDVKQRKQADAMLHQLNVELRVLADANAISAESAVFQQAWRGVLPRLACRGGYAGALARGDLEPAPQRRSLPAADLHQCPARCAGQDQPLRGAVQRQQPAESARNPAARIVFARRADRHRQPRYVGRKPGARVGPRAARSPTAVADHGRHRSFQAVQRPLRPPGGGAIACGRWRRRLPTASTVPAIWRRITVARRLP